ncbi:hypothetical protein GIB67_004843 [Kingdonia uniflora]|uniref:TF-B3 domain-containing protein n=1 Tax=Kingdonia uniflora TaxID=39325 RepID=A0A7J7LNQ0_9MAGN|nr:hypothetical protein GIB67_004843 [Kingdonia uniflora]
MENDDTMSAPRLPTGSTTSKPPMVVADHAKSSVSKKEKDYDRAKTCARERAEEVQKNLDPKHPNFVKSMKVSHVGGCFMMSLHTPFCNSYLPKKDIMITLVDENETISIERYVAQSKDIDRAEVLADHDESSTRKGTFTDDDDDSVKTCAREQEEEVVIDHTESSQRNGALINDSAKTSARVQAEEVQKKNDYIITLVDENKAICTVQYMDKVFCGGWKAFSIGHNLVEGGSMVFHLVKHTEFQVYDRAQSSSRVDFGSGHQKSEARVKRIAPRIYFSLKARSNTINKVEEGADHAWTARAKPSAIEQAEEVQHKLDPNYPSFVKTMFPSNVSGNFWLALPSKFCASHLPKNNIMITLIDMKDEEYTVKYIVKALAVSAGWRIFVVAHKLTEGDALVFELVEDVKFKVYLIRTDGSSGDNEGSSLCSLNVKAKQSTPCKRTKRLSTPEKAERKRRKTALSIDFGLEEEKPKISRRDAGSEVSRVWQSLLDCSRIGIDEWMRVSFVEDVFGLGGLCGFSREDRKTSTSCSSSGQIFSSLVTKLSMQESWNPGLQHCTMLDAAVLDLVADDGVVSKEVKKWRPAGADHGFIFLHYNLAVAYHRTNLLAHYGWWSASVNGGYCWWAPSKFDPIKSPMLFFEKDLSVIPPIKPEIGLDIVLKNMILYVNKRMRPAGIRIFHTQSPRHFEEGDWDQGGPCQRVQPLLPKQVNHFFSLERNGTNADTHRLANQHMYKVLEGSNFHILDVSHMSECKADTHPTAAGGKKHNDYMHWCLPGITIDNK